MREMNGNFTSEKVTYRQSGAGDRDRTADIQLGKLAVSLRLTLNQSHTKGYKWLIAALSADIEHSSEHNSALHHFPAESLLKGLR